MAFTVSVKRDTLNASLLKLAEVSKREFRDTMRRAARSVLRRVIATTPPAHFSTANDSLTGNRDSFNAGKARIARQMSALMAPRTLKGKRTISQAFGRVLEKPVTVPTKERWPNVAALYRSHLKVSNGRLKLDGFDGKVFYVDRAKFQAVLKERQSRIGRFARGWSPAAASLGVPLPAWVSRHGVGDGQILFSTPLSPTIRVVVRNLVAGLPGELRGEMVRRLGYCLRYQEGATRREISYLFFKTAQAQAIKTRNFTALVPEGMHGG